MPNDFIQDWDRAARTGLHEAVLCHGKSSGQVQNILDQAVRKAHPLLLTRLEPAQYEKLSASRGWLDYDEISRTAIFSLEKDFPRFRVSSPRIAVVSGGSADLPVVREAVRTLTFHGERAWEALDIGVAGLWRLEKHLSGLREMPVIICAAGMDAALPTVLGGLVPGLVIAVPTSIGYGVAEQGRAALHSLLCSCAQGIVVVNIDNGFGAACAALRALGGQGQPGGTVPIES